MAKVYVSSTIRDLQAERRAVMEWLRVARHQAVDSYLPDSETVRESCLEDIGECDLYVLILGHRYGFQPKDGNPEGLSITQLEFRRAGESEVPRVALLRTNVPDVDDSDLVNDFREPLLAFRKEVQEAVRVGQFDDLAGLVQGLSAGVQHELDKGRSAQEHDDDAWVTAHLANVGRQFATHMAASRLKPGAHAEELYLDLVVAERHEGKPEDGGSTADLARDACSLEAAIGRQHSPMLLTGEGGGGKTTSLLHAASRAAERASADPGAPVPVYVNLARLTRLDDVTDLQQLVADSVTTVEDRGELMRSRAFGVRGLLLLIDSFNEMPEPMQRRGAVALRRLIDKYGDAHAFLVASRAGPYVEQLVHAASSFKTFEILRLRPDQVRTFLEGLGMQSLYERMPGELKELAGNPFMLLAIARTLAAAPEATLPRNRGGLYERFLTGWMQNEACRRELRYHYERVKKPLLSHLATRMTATAQTSLALDEAVQAGMADRLCEIHERIVRLGGMPEKWTVDDCLGEVIADGVLRRIGDQVQFMHHSVQEYFTGLDFSVVAPPEAIVPLTPKLLLDEVSEYSLEEVPTHRLVPPLVMMAGLLGDGTKLVEALAEHNAVLAAAVLASSNSVDSALVGRLTEEWLALLDSEESRSRVVGCSCLVLAGRTSTEVYGRLCALALSDEFRVAWTSQLALERMEANEALAGALVDAVLAASDESFESKRHVVHDLMDRVPAALAIPVAFARWRAAAPGSGARSRMQAVLASAGRRSAVAELQMLQAAASDPALAADARVALAGMASWDDLDAFPSEDEWRQQVEAEHQQYADRVTDALTAMGGQDDEAVLTSLRSQDAATQAAAARLVVKRRLPAVEELLEALLTTGSGGANRDLVDALTLTDGSGTAVARLADVALQGSMRLGELPPELAGELTFGEAGDALGAEVERRAGPISQLTVTGPDGVGECVSWSLMADYLPSLRLDQSPGKLELYDSRVAFRAVGALRSIPGDEALAALRRVSQMPEKEMVDAALRGRADRGDEELDGELLALLRNGGASVPVDTVLELLSRTTSDALPLVDELLHISERDGSEAHPRWGVCTGYPAWTERIHAMLVRLDAEEAVRSVLIEALGSAQPVAVAAALDELARWFSEPLDEEDRDDRLTLDLVDRLLDLVLRHEDDRVRAAAARALSVEGRDRLLQALVRALDDDDVVSRLNGAEAIVAIDAREQFGHVVDAITPVAADGVDPELRRRAGRVLMAVPHGLEPLYEPIMTLLEPDPERAISVIDELLEPLPDDANLFWWRGHAQHALEQLEEAAESYGRAFELEDQVSMIGLELANTFLDLDDAERGLEAAQRAAEIDPTDANAHAVVASCWYELDSIPEVIAAARKAVDIDPVHPNAIWILLFAHVREGDVAAVRAAFQHVQLVQERLSPPRDAAFANALADELTRLLEDEDTEVDDEMTALVDEIRSSLIGAPDRRA